MKLNKTLSALMMIFISQYAIAQSGKNFIASENGSLGMWLIGLVILIPVMILIVNLYIQFRKTVNENKSVKMNDHHNDLNTYLRDMDKQQLDRFFQLKKKKCCGDCKGNGSCHKINSFTTLIIFLLSSVSAFAQDKPAEPPPLLSQPGILITIVLAIIPILFAVVYALVKANSAIKTAVNSNKIKAAKKLAEHISHLDNHGLEHDLEDRKKALDYNLTHHELSGTEKAEDTKGILANISDRHEVHFTALKKKAVKRPALDPDVTKLILWYLGCAAFWLLLGSGIGEYVGIKFVAPDADHISWLSFGRLRPVHTNIVFWGWASLGMIGLGYYVVPTVSNTKIYSIKWGWIALAFTNAMIIAGTVCLMAGFNNGGGEFREYVWPVMALFAVALILTLANFIMTVAKRTTREIYISNWYIVSAIIFTIIVALTAYLPFWQDGVSETIVQGYFMHSGVGMWFTLYTLGLMYYFIPQQINKPIYAYSLGILAFWTQIIFYTVIGTHHFIFAPIPWWLQTVGIVGSAGMIIPVVAATINFTMTFKGQWHKVSNSYTLPFFFVAVIYYFVVSMQGTAEAFKFSNLLWHFTDFTVAHAHLGFYGIITFALWGGMYAIVPRLTGKEPPQHLVGAHFWLAFIGLLFYTIPLSVGATLRGLMWMEGKPFIDSVVMMFDFWLWRAIGGSLMFISHIVFFYNFYKMTTKEVVEIDVREEAFNILENQVQTI